MCKGTNNTKETSLVISQLRRRINDALYDIQEWKDHCLQTNQEKAGQRLGIAEEKINEALKALEEAIKEIEIPKLKNGEDFTIRVIR